MGTVLFDFDSTLITAESLDEILKPKLASSPGLARQISDITNQGMAGEIPFYESLSRRLALARPHLDDVQTFARHAVNMLTPGIGDLMSRLHQRGVWVGIASGGFREAILPAAAHLGIVPDRVFGVCPLWQPDGSLKGLDPEDIMARSKVEGVRRWIGEVAHPKIVVGDGMTDYQLYQEGLVDHFIAFTANIRRPNLIKTGVAEARDADKLAELLEDLW